jgi:hypothetical protein
MTSQRQAVAELARLHPEYCAMIDKLLPATDDNVVAVVAEEVRLGKRICDLGPKAFGAAKGARLKTMRPSRDKEWADVRGFLAAGRGLSEEHCIAIYACAVRSYRLGLYLDESKSEREPGVMARAAILYAERVAALGRPLKRGEKAKLNSEVAAEIDCEPDTVKQAILRSQKGTVPK